ncbi:MAG: hypothetical protein HC773_01395 [Scytonema sp. CRU_2_7]|nr:hypothetical protein [Scytonema sp. CRU_2_7]
MNDNRLHNILELQKAFQRDLGNDIESQEFVNMTALGLSAEIHEALGETPWKPWKKNQKSDKEKFKEEVIDIFTFTINMVLASGMDDNELYAKFMNKHSLNKSRLLEGY